MYYFLSSDLSYTNLSFMRIADLDHSNLTGADLSNASLQTARNVDFTNANLTNATFLKVNLAAGVALEVVDTTNAIFDNTTCPDGTNSDDNVGNVCYL